MTQWLTLAWTFATDRRARAAVRLLLSEAPAPGADRRDTLHVIVDNLHAADVGVVERLARYRQARRLLQRQRRRLRRLERAKGGV